MRAGSTHAESSRDLMRGPRAEDNYWNVHAWLRAKYPKTGTCERCGRSDAPTEYAKRPEAEYTRNRDDYAELCRSCHAVQDGKGRNLYSRRRRGESPRRGALRRERS